MKDFQIKSSKALEQAAQGSDSIAIPGSGKKMCGYGTRGHDLVVNICGRLIVGLDDPEGPSNLKDSQTL